MHAWMSMCIHRHAMHTQDTYRYTHADTHIYEYIHT